MKIEKSLQREMSGDLLQGFLTLGISSIYVNIIINYDVQFKSNVGFQYQL